MIRTRFLRICKPAFLEHSAPAGERKRSLSFSRHFMKTARVQLITATRGPCFCSSAFVEMVIVVFVKLAIRQTLRDEGCNATSRLPIQTWANRFRCSLKSATGIGNTHFRLNRPREIHSQRESCSRQSASRPEW